MILDSEGVRPVDARRFRVRADAFYVRDEQGVWLRNNQGSFAIRGEGAYELVATLFTTLNGDNTVEEVCAGLTDGARASVVRLLDTLARNGAIREVVHPPEVPPAWMLERFPAQLAYLEHYGDRPVTRMARARTNEVCCIGTGRALLAVLDALAEFGLGKVTVLTTRAFVADVADAVRTAEASDPGLRWRAIDIGDDLDPVATVRRGELSGARHVLFAVDEEVPGLGTAQEWLRRSGRDVGIIGPVGQFMVAVPPQVEGACWECVERSMIGSATVPAADLPAGATAATIAALQVTQQLFATVTGVPLDGAVQVTSVEPVAPIVRTHTVHRHPLCEAHRPDHGDEPIRREEQARPQEAGGRMPDGSGSSHRRPRGLRGAVDDRVRPDIPASTDPADLVAQSDRIVAVCDGWTDRLTGPFLTLGEESQSQVPLSVSTCRVPDPLSTAAAPADKLVIRRAVSAREARNQVALSAVEWMAGRVLRGRELLGPADLLAAGWSRAEALYRARAAAAFRAIPAEIDWRPTSDGVLTADPVRDYLTRTLLSGGHAVREVATARQQDGFVRARLRIVDGLEAHGIGLDPGHAVRDLLLRAVAGIGAERAEVCLPAPPVDTWGEALARLDDVSPGPPWQEDSSWLPFLDSQAYVVRLPGAPEW